MHGETVKYIILNLLLKIYFFAKVSKNKKFLRRTCCIFSL